MFQITTPAFKHGESIPARYTCEGENISPELIWTDPPAGTVSFVLTVFDPDAPRGGFLHWLLYDIPGTCRGIAENQPGREKIPGIATQGITDFKRVGYGGPCPPKGVHRYFFTLYALDYAPGLPARKSLKEVQSAMENHILGKCEVMGTCCRTGC